MEEYIVDGKTYSKSQLESFAISKDTTLTNLLQKNPQIKAKTSPVNQSAFAESGTALNMGSSLGSTSLESQEDDTFIERALGKNIITDFFGDIYRAGVQGFQQSQAVGENIDVFNKGVDADDETILNFIRANKKAQGSKMSDEMRDFSRIYEEEGKGVWGFIKGVLKNPSVIPQVFVSSMATLAGSALDSDEVAKAAIAGAGGGAVAGSAFAGVGAIPGGFAGLFGGLGGAMETGLTFGELLQDELNKEGKDFSLDNVKELLADEDRYKNLKRRAVGRGIAIGAIETLSGGLAGKAFTAAGRGVRGATAAIGTEAIGGSTGEVVGRLAAGQEMDVAEIGFEGIAGTATAPVNIAAAMINAPEYKMHGKKASLQDVLDQIDANDADFLASRIQITNNPELSKIVQDKIVRLGKKAEIETRVTDKADLETILDLETELENIGTPKTRAGKKRKSELETEIDDILNKYDKIDPSKLKDDAPIKIFAENLMKANVAETIQFAEETSEKLGFNQVTLKNTEEVFQYLDDNNIKYTAKQKKQINTLGGFVLGNSIFINEDIAAKTGNINVGAHEVVHGILQKYVGNNLATVVKDFKNTIGQEHTDIVLKELTDRGYTKDQFDKEFLSVYSDAISKGLIKFDNNLFTKIGDFIVEKILRPLGFAKIGFENGKQVYNFMKEYQKGVSEGGMTAQLEKALADIKPTTDKAKDTELTASLFNEVNNLLPQNIETKAQYDTFVRSPQGAKLFNSIYTGAIAAYIKSKSVSSIEAEKVIENVINRTLKFNPEEVRADGTKVGRDGFVERVMSDTRFAKLDTKKALFEEGEQRKQETRIEDREEGEGSGLQIADQAAPTQTTEDKQKPTIRPLERLVPESEVREMYREEVKQFLEGADIYDLNYKTLTDVAPDITKQIFGATFLDKRVFIRKNAKALYNMLPENQRKRAVGLKTATGLKGVLQKAFYEAKGRATMAQGTAAGLTFREKKPYNEEAFFELFGLLPGQEKTRNQKTAISALESEIGKAITNSVVREQLKVQGTKADVIFTIEDGKSELLASQTYLVDNNGVEIETQKVINERIASYDPKPTVITKDSDIINPIYDKLIADYPTTKAGKPIKKDHLLRYVREYNARKTLLINNPGFKAVGDLKGPSNSTGSDITIINPDTKQEVTFEAKSKKGDFHGSFSLKLIDGVLSLNKGNITNAVAKKVIDILNKKGFVAALNEYITETGATLSPKGSISVDVKAHNEKGKGLIPNVNIPLKNLGPILSHYADTDFLYHAAENALYSIGDTGTNVTPLKGTMQIEMRLKAGGSENGRRGMTISGGLRLKSIDKSNTKADKFTIENELLASKNIGKEFQNIIEYSKGIKVEDVIGDVTSRQLGKKKDKFKPFVPYSAEDFEGLMYVLYGKGPQGDENAKWFKDNFYRPLSEGIIAFDGAKQAALENLKVLKKEIKKIGIDLGAESTVPGFTKEQAIRTRIWYLKGYEIPGLTPEEAQKISNSVRQDFDSMKLMEKLDSIFPENIYPEPTDPDWLAGTILTDLLDHVNDKTRKEYLQPFFNNIEQTIGKFTSGNKLQGENVNRLRAGLGNEYIKSLENMLTRIKSGRNRVISPDSLTNSFMDWVNNSVGTIMFFNTRSALLQTISNFNYINWSDNNPVKAGAAFANQKQFWSDFAFLYNSDFLKSRRSGLKTDVNADEIAKATARSNNKIKAALAAILKKGFLPTQIADSFAISIGGASMYRNRINKYLSEGQSKKDAEANAFRDFTELTEAAQQSSRPDRISMQQAGPLGRIILAFQNTPMQYTRLIKKSVLDLINNRGDWKTNISKIVYYGAVQNIIFHSLQTALFALAFDDEEDDKKKERYFNIGNRMADSILIGTGVYGAIAATTKNVIMEVIEQEKGRKDFQKAAIMTTAISPPINSKLQKMLRAGRRFTYKQEREKMKELGLDTRNPAVLSGADLLSAVFNLPADRAIRKWNNLVLAADSETELWQSVALALGYSEWDVKLGPNQKEPKMNARIKIPREKIKREKIKREKIKRN